MATSTIATPPSRTGFDAKRAVKGFALLIAVYLVVVYLIPKPAAVKPEGWRLTGIFLATIVGSVVEPIPAGALVLIAITLTAVSRSLTTQQALGGYSDPTGWLVLTAFIISRALIKCGLARRIALNFVRLFGRSSLGVTYSLAMSDLVLAGMIPSNGARSGGVILPIALSISEIYGSKPGATAGVLGSFLMVAVYQSICITTAMFLTGQASNPLAARFAEGYGYHITWLTWLEATIVPGAVSLLIVPWLVMKLHPPEIKHTPEAPAFARGELAKMGPMTLHEKIVAGIFALVCGLWVSSSWSKIDITQTALIGAVLLLITGMLTWDDVKSEREAWSVFVWYAGLLRLGQALGDAGVTKAFADGVAKQFGHLGWAGLLAVALVVYFYAHYAFASITAHVVSMFPPFLAVLLMQGGPPGIIVYTFAILANLAAGLTHFGTTPGPIFFAHGYTTLKVWWKVGLIISFVNLAIWTTIGFAWWKVIGVW